MCFLHILVTALREVVQPSVYVQRGSLSQLIIQWHLCSAYCLPGHALVARQAMMNVTDDPFPALLEFIVWGKDNQ